MADGVLTRVAMLEAVPGIPVRISAGVVTYPQVGVDRSEVFSVADQALYLAKGSGKGSVRVYRPDITDMPDVAGLPTCPTARPGSRPRRARARRGARDAYTGRRPFVVEESPRAVAQQLGLGAGGR